jgi:hypothetical protein
MDCPVSEAAAEVDIDAARQAEEDNFLIQSGDDTVQHLVEGVTNRRQFFRRGH